MKWSLVRFPVLGVVIRQATLSVFICALLCANAAAQADDKSLLRIYSPSDPHELDPNGFLLNPRWLGNDGRYPANDDRHAPYIEERCRFRVETRHLERRALVVTNRDCLSPAERQLVSLNEAPQTLGLGTVCVTGEKTGLVQGHVNWFPVTAIGQLLWNSFSAGVGDHDVNIDLVPRVPNASTRANAWFQEFFFHRGYHLEFYSGETLDRIPKNGPGLWPSLKRALNDKKKAKGLLDNRLAIVNGVYGLDGVHGYHAELHPVFALAILIAVDTPRTQHVREEWAIMVRNMGSEGDCAFGTLPLLTSPEGATAQTFLIDLGAWQNAGQPVVSIDSGWISSTRYLPGARYAPSGSQQIHLYLEFPQPRPTPGGKDVAFLGTVMVEWTRPGSTPWQDRFDEWLFKPGARPAIKLTPITDRRSEGLPLDTLIEQSAAPGLGTQALVEISDRLVPVGRMPVLVTTTPPPVPSSARVYAMHPWPVGDTVSRCCESATRFQPLSMNARRTVVGLSGPNFGSMFPFLGVYIFPHSAHYPGEEGPLADILSIFPLFGYRFDVRRDVFVPIINTAGVTSTGRRRTGPGFRAAMIVSPNTFRLSQHYSISPYTIGHLGTSRFKEDQFEMVWGWGVGLQADIHGPEIFAEAQTANRKGNYVRRWEYSTGLLFRGLPSSR